MSGFDNQRHEPITATRDDERRVAVPQGKNPPESGRSLFSPGNLVILLLALVVLFSFALIWKQSAEIDALRQQFDELSGLIKNTDQSLSQSGTALSMKIREQGETLDKHWSEIKKLWGISYDRNRKDIEANKKAVEQVKTVANQAKTVADSQQKLVSQSQETLTKLEGEVKAMEAALKNLSDSSLATSVQLEDLETQLAAIQSVKKSLTGLSTRVAETEAAIKALDVYRSQINQQMLQLQQKVQQPQ